jgi:glucose/arabinose dehydrogenase
VDDVLLGGLDQPNSLAFLPDGRALFVERVSGKVRMLVGGQLALSDPCVVVDSLTTDLERGLQGIAVDPRWPAFPYVYVAHTIAGSRMVLVRYTASGDLSDPAGTHLWLDSRRVIVHDMVDAFPRHNGLGLRFMLDGTLLLSTGDDFTSCYAQIAGSLRGTLLRMDVTRVPAGPGGPPPRAILIPPGNPTVGPDSNACLEYVKGLRNPWRFHVDALTGDVLLADVGENAQDEIDEIKPGNNYGWPWREGTLVLANATCPEPPNGLFTAPIVTPVRAEGFIALLTAGVYRPPTGGSANWPSLYQGSLFYSDYFFGLMRRAVRSGSTWVTPSPVPGQPSASDWGTGFRQCSDFGVGPDGSLWWLKASDDANTPSSGSIHRVRYTGTVDVPPDHTRERTLRAAPNPFRESVTFDAHTGAGGTPDVEVFDLGGRRLRRLQASEAGSVVWDGRADDGASVPAGLYLARVRAGETTVTTRVLRVR